MQPPGPPSISSIETPEIGRDPWPTNGGLFNPSVPKKQLHPSFKLVQSSPRNKSTRRLMNDAFARFVEKDGNFVEQFQTTGFNTRTFELYVSELLHAEGFTFEGTEPQPDFCVSKNGVKVAIECTTANPTGSTLHVYEPMNEKDDDLEDIRLRQENDVPCLDGLQGVSPIAPRLRQ